MFWLILSIVKRCKRCCLNCLRVCEIRELRELPHYDALSKRSQLCIQSHTSAGSIVGEPYSAGTVRVILVHCTLTSLISLSLSLSLWLVPDISGVTCNNTGSWERDTASTKPLVSRYHQYAREITGSIERADVHWCAARAESVLWCAILGTMGAARSRGNRCGLMGRWQPVSTRWGSAAAVRAGASTV